MGFGDGSGISWTICKQSAPRCRQITTPTPHHSIFTGRMLFLTPNQQCQMPSLKDEGGNVSSVKWQVTMRDHIWHVSSRSSQACGKLD